MAAYLYIYNNWRIYELPWDSAVTWVVAAILCDLGYYWVHRAAHGKLFYFQCSVSRNSRSLPHKGRLD